jgi:hypothetical protein
LGNLYVFEDAFWSHECWIHFPKRNGFSFRDLIGKIIEIYQDDLMVVSKEINAHVSHLRKIFERCRKYGISLNPKKSIFGIDKGKLLGHVVSEEGIFS